jgi:hypothetical protein
MVVVVSSGGTVTPVVKTVVDPVASVVVVAADVVVAPVPVVDTAVVAVLLVDPAVSPSPDSTTNRITAIEATITTAIRTHSQARPPPRPPEGG